MPHTPDHKLPPRPEPTKSQSWRANDRFRRFLREIRARLRLRGPKTPGRPFPPPGRGPSQ